MKKNVYSMTAPKRGMLLIVIMALALTSCHKDWPDLTPATDTNNGWQKNGYQLFTGESAGVLKAADGDLSGVVNVAQLFVVFDQNGQSVPGVNFLFGDGTSVIGEQVIHKYAAIGRYTLTAYVPGGTELSGAINITATTTPPAGDIMKLAPSTFANGQWTYTIGLPTDYIYSYDSTGGWCWVEGTTAGWPASPADAYALSQTRWVNNTKYLVYTFTKSANDWEEFIWGETLNDNTNHWAFDTASVFFHSTATGGIFRAYLQDGEIYSEKPAAIMPGNFGDAGEDWLVRGSVTDTDTSYTVSLYLNTNAITTANNPQLQYKLETDSVWTNVSLTANTDYYAATIAANYESLVSFNFLAESGNPATLVDCQTSVLYSTSLACLALQLHSGIQ